MARPTIRHIAIMTRDTEKLAKFYQDVFEMEVVHRSPNEGGGIFVSDGYLTMAILPHSLTGEAAVGINHFGFQIEDAAEIETRLAASGVETPKQRPSNRPYAEKRACDPDGNQFDLSVHGFAEVETGAERAAKRQKELA